MAPLSIPPELKKITVFLRRAEELDRDKSSPESRVVAFNCRQYAVLNGIPLVQNSAAAKVCLSEILSQLEKEKPAMETFSKSEHWSICRKVADRVFEKADSEDRVGLASKGTAKTFYAAGTFYEILQQFHENKAADELEEDETKEQRDEEEQRRLYCKWKATEILNAIKEGRAPTPGGYQQNEPEEEEAVPIGDGHDIADEQSTNDAPSQMDVELPPAPAMPSSDFFAPIPAPESDEVNEEQEEIDVLPPPAYNGIEINLNGDPEPSADTQPIAEDVNENSSDDGGDIFIPGPLKSAAANASKNADNLPPPASSAPAPPSYSEYAASTQSTTRSASKSPPPPPASAARATTNNTAKQSSTSGGGIFSSVFGKSSSAKLSKEQMSDAVELTKFALAALQKGDGELGKERLQQALDVLRR